MADQIQNKDILDETQRIMDSYDRLSEKIKCLNCKNYLKQETLKK